MSARTIYRFLCIVGTILPFSQVVMFGAAHGLDRSEFVRQLFATRIATFFAFDVMISAVVLLVFIGIERRRHRIVGVWLPILAVFVVGVSLALPLYLYQRERHASRTSE
jgi:hypothetical protein